MEIYRGSFFLNLITLICLSISLTAFAERYDVVSKGTLEVDGYSHVINVQNQPDDVADKWGFTHSSNHSVKTHVYAAPPPSDARLPSDSINSSAGRLMRFSLLTPDGIPLLEHRDIIQNPLSSEEYSVWQSAINASGDSALINKWLQMKVPFEIDYQLIGLTAGKDTYIADIIVDFPLADGAVRATLTQGAEYESRFEAGLLSFEVDIGDILTGQVNITMITAASATSYSYQYGEKNVVVCASANIRLGDWPYANEFSVIKGDIDSVTSQYGTRPVSIIDPNEHDCQFLLTVEPPKNGTINSEPSGINCPTDCEEAFLFYSTTTLTATPEAGYTFVGWQGDCLGTGSCILPINSDKNVSAKFLAHAEISLQHVPTSMGIKMAWLVGQSASQYTLYWDTEPFIGTGASNQVTTSTQNYIFENIDPFKSYYFRVQATSPTVGNLSAMVSASTVFQISHRPVQISTGYEFSCALVGSNVICWGSNNFGPLNSFGLINPILIDSEGFDTCVIEDRGVLCWGRNEVLFNAKPTLSNPYAISVGYGFLCALDDSGAACWGGITHQQDTPPVLYNPTAIAAGFRHVCALDDSGVKCWGDNTYGQISVPSLSNPIAISLGTWYTCAIDDNGPICWGQDIYGAQYFPSEASAISAGKSHACAIENGEIICWGNGAGYYSDGGSGLPYPTLNNVTIISAGADHTCAIDDSGIRCWNYFTEQEGTVAPISVINAMGELLPPEHDTDNDGTPDINDDDIDGDGLPNDWEVANGLNPYNADDVSHDVDFDGLTNLEEYQAGTDPHDRDTDGDGVADGVDEAPLVPVKTLNVDINQNNFPDIPLLGTLSNSKKAVIFYDSLTGAQTGVVYIPSWFTCSQVEVLSDLNGNSFNDIVVLGITSDGKKAWLTFDSKTGKLLTGVTFPSWFQLITLAVVPDYNGNNKDEILVLGETSDGKKVWMLHDSGLKVEIGRYVYPRWYSPVAINIVKDTDGNNKPEVVSSGTSSDGKSVWMLHDLHSKTQLRAVKQASWYSLTNLQQLDDVSGNTLDDVVWLGNTTDGKNFFKIEDANTGILDSTYIYPSWYTPNMLTSQQDSSGNGFAEIVSLGTTTDGKKAWQAHDAYNHTVSAAKVFPAWYQPQTLKVLPDVDGDGVEDILVRGSTTDGKTVLMVQSGATGADIKVLVLPSWFTPM